MIIAEDLCTAHIQKHPVYIMLVKEKIMIVEFNNDKESLEFLKSLNPCRVNGGGCVYQNTKCGWECQILTLKQYVKKTEMEKLKADFEDYHAKYPVKWVICGYVRAMERTIRNKK